MKGFVKRITSKKRGFTLVELIVVIAILGVLAAILVPTMLGIVRDAREATNRANARSVYSAAQLAYVSLSTAGDFDFSAEATYDSSTDGSNEFIQKIRNNLGAGFDGDFKVTAGPNGVISAEYDGVVYNPEASDEGGGGGT